MQIRDKIKQLKSGRYLSIIEQADRTKSVTTKERINKAK